MKPIRSLLAILLMAASLSSSAHAEEPPETSAMSFILMDAGSSRTLAAAGECEPRLIASTTKIMTALIVLEHCDPDSEAVIQSDWTGIEGSSMHLKAGETLTVRDLLYGLMLESGNDAAVALACICAGDVASFSGLMNERAAALGCDNTHFVNPSGLDADGQYSCARDLAIIAREAIHNDEFRKIVSTLSASVGGMTLTNHNRLLRECEGVFGVKTGYTKAAGRTLVSCCERGGVTLICVTLSDPDDWKDHAALYDWAYDEFSPYDAAQIASLTVPVIGGEDESVLVVPAEPVYILLGKGESVRTQITLPPFVFADVEKGAYAGEITVSADREAACRVRLVFSDSVARVTSHQAFCEQLQSLPDLLGRSIYALL